jgi:hypothetical protein
MIDFDTCRTPTFRLSVKGRLPAHEFGERVVNPIYRFAELPVTMGA